MARSRRYLLSSSTSLIRHGLPVPFFKLSGYFIPLDVATVDVVLGKKRAHLSTNVGAVHEGLGVSLGVMLHGRGGICEDDTPPTQLGRRGGHWKVERGMRTARIMPRPAFEVQINATCKVGYDVKRTHVQRKQQRILAPMEREHAGKCNVHHYRSGSYFCEVWPRMRDVATGASDLNGLGPWNFAAGGACRRVAFEVPSRNRRKTYVHRTRGRGGGVEGDLETRRVAVAGKQVAGVKGRGREDDQECQYLMPAEGDGGDDGEWKRQQQMQHYGVANVDALV
ncbi:uncharacterized protein EV420DRAFT_1479961 [Desarmillaria tabescens]|uniref:Uncharacterized protein n=1 Tax=Armillaria tabescens TaxID=1929756 RepID=A0AA39KC19_ARMTA|nr:uncharacterized protein EV420DRAFT_1479961 [Desarmillaria tabescens]KAK0458217.1 hypothetical protein EV420DRAFT_1479961 [Desarmillaria tabescens]